MELRIDADGTIELDGRVAQERAWPGDRISVTTVDRETTVYVEHREGVELAMRSDLDLDPATLALPERPEDHNPLEPVFELIGD